MRSTTTPSRRLAILMTSFNRKAMTLEALNSLVAQQGVEDLDITVYLVDDGSHDGTSEAVREQYPLVKLIRGDGSLFWNGGMRLAFSQALEVRFDHYVWFNDDTLLAQDALIRIMACATAAADSLGPAIIVGSICDPMTRAHSYGGVIRKPRGLKIDFIPQPPDETRPLRCDTMNGNFTLIPQIIAMRLGNLDSLFTHQLADFDYGLRATAAGLPILVAPGYFGQCSDNSAQGTWRDTELSLAKRWRNLMSPKGAPPREWLRYTRRHFGWRWPLYAISPYFKTLLNRH